MQNQIQNTHLTKQNPSPGVVHTLMHNFYPTELLAQIRPSGRQEQLRLFRPPGHMSHFPMSLSAPFPFWEADVTNLYYTQVSCPIGAAQITALSRGPHLSVSSVTQVYGASTFSISWLPIYTGSRAASIQIIILLTAEHWFSNRHPGTLGVPESLSGASLESLRRGLKSQDCWILSLPLVALQQFCFFPY